MDSHVGCHVCNHGWLVWGHKDKTLSSLWKDQNSIWIIPLNPKDCGFTTGSFSFIWFNHQMSQMNNMATDGL